MMLRKDIPKLNSMLKLLTLELKSSILVLESREKNDILEA